ncbi:LysR family transcriptional regulator [Photobacterium damselae subsp. damselae]|uniref:LysR family transcriptional regulator n=2 Tax=Photobacterium damselae TaxID=38293 RepID=UPI000D0584F9|nr:LysR family transcriptional regulator [Photobacterium damselae]PSB88695.1 LysR family transcriptional regulator [Photobacterium damselae subsp. damselae]TLS82424.1 LysR family transcriptional regulator [Photobacterium damselae subsp. damselae]TLS91231.1 LysR family transcriptional regulator [Photobacterium damselae subsp. damselae]
MDKLGAMRAFVRVVQTGSFSATGRELNTSQTAISKKVAALEKEIGVKLLTRNSRELALTPSGTEYFNKCVAILGEIDEAEASAREDVAVPKGVLRISAPIAFSRLVLASLLSEFNSLYPEISIDLLASDQHVDLISSGVDVAIRARNLEDSTLIARHLFDNVLMLFASPDYLAKNGTPNKPEDLLEHNCLVYSRLHSVNTWSFSCKQQEHLISVHGSFRCDNGDVLLDAALAGLGITHLPKWMVSRYVESGELVPLLVDYEGQKLPFNAVYLQNRYVPLKVRCFVDFLKQKIDGCGEFFQ